MRPIVTRLLLLLAPLIGLVQVGTAHAAGPIPPDSPCSLLTAAEVEAVLGGPLAGPPFRASNGVPDAKGSSCRYETPAFRAIDINVKWTNGGRALGLINLGSGIIDNGGMKGVVTLSDGTKLRGEWDEARLFQCCKFSALRGDQLVVVDISAVHASVEQAAALADLAVRRLDKPLSIDTSVGLASAEQRAKTRPAITPACGLVTRTEAEAIVGASLSADPQGGPSSCKYTWLAREGGYREQITLSVNWRGGFSAMRLAQDAIGQASSFIGIGTLSRDPVPAPANGLLDEEDSSIVGVMGVRKDVLLSIETGGIDDTFAKAFIETAARKF